MDRIARCADPERRSAARDLPPAPAVAARSLPPRDFRRGAELVPASVAHAALLAVPHGLDGHRPALRDLPGALHALPGEPRPARGRGVEYDRPQGVVLRGRWRDGRAG